MSEPQGTGPDMGQEPGPAMDESLEKRRLAQETKNERQVWYFLAYFLFGIHFVAFVMIYAVRHAH
ncbi:hypothetical protein ACFY1J_36895 [Streptomyces sp. NPDC001406]|jgi:nitrate reductase NapE component|uniref:hypothetical protein n=1 Tax=Streptomyces sp. NPDC001406 TaxID=3364572 RepID=UPI00368DC676